MIEFVILYCFSSILIIGVAVFFNSKNENNLNHINKYRRDMLIKVSFIPFVNFFIAFMFLCAAVIDGFIKIFGRK